MGPLGWARLCALLSKQMAPPPPLMRFLWGWETCPKRKLRRTQEPKIRGGVVLAPHLEPLLKTWLCEELGEAHRDSLPATSLESSKHPLLRLQLHEQANEMHRHVFTQICPLDFWGSLFCGPTALLTLPPTPQTRASSPNAQWHLPLSA